MGVNVVMFRKTREHERLLNTLGLRETLVVADGPSITVDLLRLKPCLIIGY